MSKSILKSSAMVALITLISRLFGVIRDIIFAHYLGYGGATDCFFIAFKIPNFMRRIIAEGAFSQAFIPILSEYKECRTEHETTDFIRNIYGTLGATMLIVASIGMIATPVLAMIFTPAWFFNDYQKYQMTAQLLKFTIPYMFFISMVACCGSILNTYGKFAVSAFTPVLLNICLICATIWLAPNFETPQIGVACGVLIAGVVQLTFQLPFLYKLKLLTWPAFGWTHIGIKKVIKLMLPSIIGSSASQINMLIGSILASTLISGSVSWLYYSDRLMEFPVGIIGITLGTVILPKLSKDHISKTTERFSKTMDFSLQIAVLITLPSVIGLIMLAEPLIATIFGHGKIDQYGIEMASKSLIAYACGIIGFILVKVLSPAFYARHDAKTPMKFGIYSVIINIILSIILIFPLAHTGLALATSIAAITNAAFLLLALLKQGIYKPQISWKKFLIKTTTANLILAIFLSFTPGANEWVSWGIPQKVITLAGLIAAGILLYLLTTILLKAFPKIHDT